MRRCGYGRVSTDHQESSIENQKAWFEKLEIKTFFYDNAVSGVKLNRPGFSEMLVKCGLIYRNKHWEPDDENYSEFDEIVVKQTSRFARNTDCYSIIQALRVKNVSVNFIEDNINTRTTERDFFFQLLSVFDMNDSRDKSRKLAWAHERGKERGILHTSSKLYGYKFIRSENRLEIYEPEAEVVRLMFKLYSQGIGCHLIAKELHDRGYVTKGGKPFTVKDKSTILNIVSNEKMAGFDNRMKHFTGEIFTDSRHPRKKSEYTYSPSEKIPAIIDKETFVLCQEIRKKRSQGKRHVGHGKYAGKLLCECGAPFHQNKIRGRRMYNCARKKHEGISICHNRNLWGEQLDDMVRLAASQFPEIMNDLYRKEMALLNSDIAALLSTVDQNKEEEVKLKKEQIANLEAKFSALLELAGTLDISLLQDKLKSVQIELEVAKGELEILGDYNNHVRYEIANKERMVNRFKSLANACKQKYTSDEILAIIDYIKIGENSCEVSVGGLNFFV